MTLNELEIGKSAVIVSVGGQGALRQHFLDMGVIPGTEVTMVKLAPMGDPMELRIHGYELTLRLNDAREIGIGPVPETDAPPEHTEDSDGRFLEEKANIHVCHPGLGEGGIYHMESRGTELPAGETG